MRCGPWDTSNLNFYPPAVQGIRGFEALGLDLNVVEKLHSNLPEEMIRKHYQP